MNPAGARKELATRLATDPHFWSLSSTGEGIRHCLQTVTSYEELKTSLKEKLSAIKSSTRKKSLQLATDYKHEAEWYFQYAGQLHQCLHAVQQALRHTPQESNDRNGLILMASLYCLKAAAHYRRREYTAMLYSAEMAIEFEPPASKEEGRNSSSSSFIKYCKVKVQALGLLRRYASAIRLIDELLATAREGDDDEGFSDLHALKGRLQADGKVEDEVVGEELDDSSSSRPLKLSQYHLDDRCCILNSPTVGRHFIASEAIPEGDILLRERPYSAILETAFLQKRCTACHRPLQYRFFPW